MSEAQVRAILKACATSGLDPYLALQKAGLLWDRAKVVQARTATLRAAAQAFGERAATSFPYEALTSPWDMKEYLTGYLNDLADLQEQNHGQSKKDEVAQP